MFILPAPIIHALLFATYSWALGINCRGTTDCTSIRNFAKDQGFLPANEINKSIQSMSDEAFYMDQQPIACCSTVVPIDIYRDGYVSKKICAFLLNARGAFGIAIKTFSGQIVDHGCEACGSIPVDNQDVKNGELIFMYVKDSDSVNCSGLCPSYNGY